MLQIDTFVASLIKKAGITDPVIRDVATRDISIQLEEFLSLKLVEQLPIEKREEYFEMKELFPSSFNAYEFFHDQFPDLETRMSTLLSEFEQIFLSRRS